MRPEYYKRRLVQSLIFLGIGILALLLGKGFNIQPHAMNGIAFGFIPVGLGMTIIYLKMKNTSEMKRVIESEEDERNLFVRNKAGYLSFWITFWCVFVITMFGDSLHIKLSTAGVSALIIMSVVYFFFYYYYCRKF
ncbi:MAG: hypothetical protein ACM3UZ_10995 [Acidobacteriota bacterium]